MKKFVLVPIIVASVVVSWLIWNASPQYIKQGGPLLVLGLTCFFLALTFAIERLVVMWRAGRPRATSSGFVQSLKESVHQGETSSVPSKPARRRAAASPTWWGPGCSAI